MQTSDAGRLAVAPLVDRGEGREDEIYRAVDEGHVNAENLDDRLIIEEFERPYKSFGNDGFPTASGNEELALQEGLQGNTHTVYLYRQT